MYEITRLPCNPHAKDLLPDYQLLVPESLHEALSGLSPDHNSRSIVIAIGALFMGTPVGVVLASYSKYPCLEVCFHHIFVQPEHRNKKIGSRLFQACQQEAYKEGGRLFLCLYPKEEPYSFILEKIFSKCGWESPRPFLLRCHGNIHTMNIPLITDSTNSWNFPAEMKEFLWKDLTAEMRRQLLFQEKNHAFSQFVSPFNNEKKIEFSNSIGLLYRGSVAGWMITHRIKPDTIRYSALHVDPALRHRKLLGLKLITDAVDLQKKGPFEWAELEVPIVNVPKAWVNFVKQRIVPYVEKVTTLYQAWKGM